MIEGAALAKAGFKYLGAKYENMDCQAFVEQCLSDCGIKKDLAGSNAWFREVYKNGLIMTPETCVSQYGRVPAGAFLFILEQDGKEPAKYQADGLGNASHIGIVTGTGKGAIHSSASRGGVVESAFSGKTIKNGGWNRVGLWDSVDYGIGGGSDAATNPEPAEDEDEEATYAEVTADRVNTRKGPGTDYPQSKAGRLDAGAVVEIIMEKTVSGTAWAEIKCTDRNGATWYCWIMRKYLREIMDPGDGQKRDSDFTTKLYTAHIPHLTEYQADAIIQSYAGAWMTAEEG